MSEKSSTVAWCSSSCSTPHDGVFSVDERVKWNYWTDRRDSGWFFGTVIDGPIRMNGILCYQIKYDRDDGWGPFPSWKPAILLERA